MSLSSPYLSIVVVARNDNYGGDFNTRLRNFLHWLTALIEKNHLPAELIIVDYNPVMENESLSKMFDWPKNRKHLTIRLLHVPNEIHKQLINPAVRKTVPLFEFIAKNMAVRRANGEYILCTNADILFHPLIVGFIAEKKLEENSYYRADRFDYRKIDFYDFDKPYATLLQIQQKVFRLMLKGYAYEIKEGADFSEEFYVRLQNSWHLFLDLHPGITQRWEMHVNQDGYAMNYHTHCSGDFMLMHRDNWFNLRSYPEDTYVSTHCDALFTVMADVSGLQEKILPWPIYHQDHERRYNTDFDKMKEDKDLNAMFKRFLNESILMESLQKPKITNPPNWGCADENFAETLL